MKNFLENMAKVEL